MDFLTCILLNGPLVILSCLAGAFYIFCIVCSSHQERLKQPLKLLLGILICSTVSYQMLVPALIFSGKQTKGEKRWNKVVMIFMNFSMTAAMNSSVWLNFFYYTQIVPAQRALFIWIKKNIKQIIYAIWLVEGILNLFRAVVRVLNTISFDNLGYHNNFTMGYCQLRPGPISKSLSSIAMFLSIVYLSRLTVCLSLMLMSSASTAAYLCRHMHQMGASIKSFSCPRLKSQVRVTVIGILQGLMFMAYVFWALYMFCTRSRRNGKSEYTFLHVTAMSFYMTGTMLNLGAGQSVFRQRVADLWVRVTQWCRAEIQQSEAVDH